MLINFPLLKREGGLIREGGFIEDLRYLFKHHPKIHLEWMKILTFRTLRTHPYWMIPESSIYLSKGNDEYPHPLYMEL